MSKFRIPVFAALILVISLAIADAVLAPAPAPAQLDLVDTVLASRAVVVAIALIARRQWLAEANEAIEDLEERVAYTHQLIDREGR